MIKLKSLTKRYGNNLVAVDNLTLDIEENEIFGLLGSNGAGKTTTIHMLATLLKPTSGTATVNGYDIVRQPSKVRESIGIVFQAPSSDDMLTGYENLYVHSLLYSVPRDIRKKRIDEVLELVGLSERKNDRVKTYSGGMRRRLEIARGLLHKPRVMFLDEPTLGLDPASRETMWKYVRRLVEEEKVTIILTTHYMEEADMLCDRIGVIDRGKIVALDTPARLKAALGGDIIKIKTKAKDADVIASKLDFVQKAEFVDGLLVLSVRDAKRSLPVLLQKIEAEQAEFSSPTLNDVFIHLTGRNIKEQAEGGFMERYAQYDD
ncbi:daunorubicin resistance ABC transporter ATP-binding subunit [Candidatus Nitrososphaera evergladensis SR1]|jgi:ABC-2 type transport system ATP-binding protein|uniref:Daunorubicin resistance ABC transporter ATP-binding subunit n=1 Tax=Candidatus Nitrososphaera evergladensis SR1 TaxID=1459636 RepID=A0A075MV28_9ARCH|nr:ATP-binding cassette domain-containing protein [Candidatus Nitrososphaera evergladensis]AIF85095.1 daunorubicin resistance ABC transporter ATP-binding subunit [Candidatus Nitrososphaera evergladensis SR1]